MQMHHTYADDVVLALIGCCDIGIASSRARGGSSSRSRSAVTSRSGIGGVTLVVMLLRLAKSLAPSLEERGTSPVGLENLTNAQLASAPGHGERDAVVPHADRAGGHGQREDEGHEQKGVKRHAGNEETKRAAGQLGGSGRRGEVANALPLGRLYSE